MAPPNMDDFNRAGAASLPGYLGIRILDISEGRVEAELPVRKELLAPHGFLHAASVVALADTACGYGCVANLPEGASSFTTIELKSNFLGTAREGVVETVATAVHLGRSTQIWDAEVKARETGKTIALFRCTQMVLWPKS